MTTKYLSCNACGHEEPNVSWASHPGIETATHNNESYPLCPECGEVAEFAEDNDDFDDEIARLRNQLHAESVAIQARLEAELRATREQRDAAVAELRRLEWSVGVNADRCPSCLRAKSFGEHRPDCTLAAALAMGEGGKD